MQKVPACIQELATEMANQEDEAIKKHLANTLFYDPIFQEWFKKHYDFCIVVRDADRIPRVVSKNKGEYTVITVTKRFGYEGPIWIPLKARIKRRFRNQWLRIYWFFRIRVPRRERYIDS